MKAFRQLADALERETARIGLWIDSSAMTSEEVVDRILANRNTSL